MNRSAKSRSVILAVTLLLVFALSVPASAESLYQLTGTAPAQKHGYDVGQPTVAQPVRRNGRLLITGERPGAAEPLLCAETGAWVLSQRGQQLPAETAQSAQQSRRRCRRRKRKAAGLFSSPKLHRRVHLQRLRPATRFRVSGAEKSPPPLWWELRVSLLSAPFCIC